MVRSCSREQAAVLIYGGVLEGHPNLHVVPYRPKLRATKAAGGSFVIDDASLTIKPVPTGKVVDYCSYAKEGDANSSYSHGLGNRVITER
jgi:hypothetical protein